jgi:EAL and modified HD-GYP domain-containing signal transduction protein
MTTADILEARADAGEMRYIARQPILDEKSRVYGYELHFEINPNTVLESKSVQATRAILDDTLIFGVDRFTNGLPAFVNCTGEALTEQLVTVLPPATSVLELSASMEVSPWLIGVCRKLKDSKFRLALVDFTGKDLSHPLLDLVDFIKVNFAELGAAECQQMRLRLKDSSMMKIANKVETQEVYRKAREAGFTYFQGYYFCHPELIRTSKIPANRASHFELMRQLHKYHLDLRKVGPLVMRDAALTYRLLRLVNSPIYGLRQEVRSIESAIIVIGENTFRRIATLAILSEINAEQPPEILHMALVRARFCELAATLSDLEPDEQYLTGMLSLLPAMMRQSMETLAPELPLRDEIRQALLGTASRERCLLSWIEAHERNELAESSTIAKANRLNQSKLLQCFIDAEDWDAAAGSGAV